MQNSSSGELFSHAVLLVLVLEKHQNWQPTHLAPSANTLAKALSNSLYITKHT